MADGPVFVQPLPDPKQLLDPNILWRVLSSVVERIGGAGSSDTIFEQTSLSVTDSAEAAEAGVIAERTVRDVANQLAMLSSVATSLEEDVGRLRRDLSVMRAAIESVNADDAGALMEEGGLQGLEARLLALSGRIDSNEQAKASRFLGLGTAQSVTIATDAITATSSQCIVDTEGAAAADNLATITGTDVIDGDLLLLRPASAARVVTAKDGTGNLQLAGDFAMSTAGCRLLLYWQASNSTWLELARSNNG